MPRPNPDYYITSHPSYFHDLYPRGPQNTSPHPPHPPTPTSTTSSSSSSMPLSLTILIPLLIFSLLLNLAIAYLWWTAHRNHRRRRLAPDDADMYGCECCGRGPSQKGRMRKARLERELRFVGVRPGRRSWFGMLGGLEGEEEEQGVVGKEFGANVAAAYGGRVGGQLSTVATTTTTNSTDSKERRNNGLLSLRLVEQARANANADMRPPNASSNPNPFADPLRQHPSYEGFHQQYPSDIHTQTQCPAPTHNRNHNRSRNRNRNSLSMFAAQLAPHPPPRDMWPPRLDSLAVQAAHQKPKSFYIERGLDAQGRSRDVQDVEMQALAGNAAPMGMVEERNAGQDRALAMLEGRFVIGDDDDDSSDDADKEYETVAGPAPQEQHYAHGGTLGTCKNEMSPAFGHQGKPGV